MTAQSLLQSNRFLVIAHRGDSRAAPENTLSAFESAVRLGADFVELDYRHSSDEALVVFHDVRLDRATNANQLWKVEKALLSDYSLAQLRGLDAGGWFSPKFVGERMPTLEESLAVIQAGSMTLIERKVGDAAACVDLLLQTGNLDRVVVQAFDWPYLAECRRLAPDLALAALGDKEFTEQKLAAISALDVQAIAWDHRHVTAETIASIHARGFKALVWTVDEPARMRELIAAGIDGIITNVPAELKRVIGRA